MTKAPQPRSAVRPLLVSLALLVGCDTTDSWSTNSCSVTLHRAKPTEAQVGDVVAIRGRPYTSAYDTAVYVGSQRATVIDLSRERCDPCDDCLEEESCTGCDDCDACDSVCVSCWEVVTIEIPPYDPGSTTLHLFNRHGESNGLDFEVLADPTDTGPTDTGPTDTSGDTSGHSGSTDTGDSMPVDTGSTDSSAPDSGGGQQAQADPDSGHAPNPDSDTP